MALRTVPYTQDHVEAVRQFNSRLVAGGCASQFPDSPVPAWLPRRDRRRLFQEYFVVTDQDAAVRGAYILKHQEFHVRGKVVSLAGLQLPISEGVVDAKYASIGARILFDSRKRQPLRFGLGGGGLHQPAIKMLKAAGWELFSVPFFFKVMHPMRFLRRTTFLRKSAGRRAMLDVLAFTGAGWAAIKSLQAIKTRRFTLGESVSAELVDEFGPWADELWNGCKSQYAMSAVRDCETLRILYPKEKSRFLRLRVKEGQKIIGWAVLLDTQMSGHKQFGDMRVGSLVDCLATEQHIPTVTRCSLRFLQQRGVDIIVSNQLDARWCDALKRAGCLSGPSNFIFSVSPELVKLLESSNVDVSQIHMNRGDGDGPSHL